MAQRKKPEDVGIIVRFLLFSAIFLLVVFSFLLGYSIYIGDITIENFGTFNFMMTILFAVHIFIFASTLFLVLSCHPALLSASITRINSVNKKDRQIYTFYLFAYWLLLILVAIAFWVTLSLFWKVYVFID